MTNEEKIAELINIRDNFNYTLAPREVFDEAIKVLEQGSVLDKIRAEIEKLDYLTIEDGSDGYDHYVDKYDVLKIVDKYRVESEVRNEKDTSIFN